VPLPTIVFVGAVYPGQFGLLCDYLQANGYANTYFLTTPGHAARNSDGRDNLRAFTPDGKIVGAQSYYYSDKVERSARISRGVLTALQDMQQTQRIDVVVAHSLWGAPHFLYDEIDAAIVSYVEMPSYRAHGWDPRYPPDLAQRVADRNTEMLNFHQVLKSDLTIVPSHHAKRLFPAELQGRIEVQLEGLDPPLKPATREPRADGPITIGFTARDLSAAKGLEVYMRLVHKLKSEQVDARFIAVGDPTAATYGYEAQWVKRQYDGEVASFRDHLLREYPQSEAIEFIGKLPYDEYSELLSDIDLFLYPLQYGVANWGLMEILMRGGCVIAPDRGYASELIVNDVNGLLLPDDDDAWIAAIKELATDPGRRARYGDAAEVMGYGLHISQVAPRYMSLFKTAMRRAAERKLPSESVS